MSGKRIYHKKSFMILKVSEGFIVYNTKKGFQEGHTHINNFNMAKTLIDLEINKKLPKSRNPYITESLLRITRDIGYKQKLEEYLEGLQTNN